MGRGRSSVWVGGTGAVPSWREPTPPLVPSSNIVAAADVRLPSLICGRRRRSILCLGDAALIFFGPSPGGWRAWGGVGAGVCVPSGDLQHPGTPDLNIFFYTHFSGVARRCPAPGPPRFCCRVI